MVSKQRIFLFFLDQLVLFFLLSSKISTMGGMMFQNNHAGHQPTVDLSYKVIYHPDESFASRGWVNFLWCTPNLPIEV